tara:strand:+ start:147 stop:1574 length:1428 start_codon:yes stop_codon:yes gene_type:complete
MSKIEVNTVAPQCGTTLTLGESGDTVTLGAGASQSGFGRTGAVDWQTTPKTATFTAVSGEGYFINSSSSITVNLPAGVAGAIVAFSDYARNFATYNLVLSPNGSEKIGGIANDGALNVNGQAATFVYVDSTKGWVNVQNAEDTEVGAPSFLSASGGTETTCGDFKIHTFTSPGTFCVSAVTASASLNTVGYLVVAGGGGGGASSNGSVFGGGGAGAGGFREGRNAPIDNFTASPLVANAPTNAVVLTAGAFPITVGAGATGGAATTCGAGTRASNGSNSVFSTITSAGGGAAGSRSIGTSPPIPAPADLAQGQPGGSGGGSSEGGNGFVAGGSGNSPPVAPPQGNNAGSGAPPTTGTSGGGGAGAVGTNGGPVSTGVAGGAGVSTSITGSSVARGGGGGSGGGGPPSPYGPGGSGGSGGGGAGSGGNSSGSVAGGNATVNTGGGGGGASGRVAPSPGAAGGNGGSGIVVIRYKFQ